MLGFVGVVSGVSLDFRVSSMDMTFTSFREHLGLGLRELEFLFIGAKDVESTEIEGEEIGK